MEEAKKVKLHGMWASTYSKRVELALRLKAIPYDYIEEDWSDKSQLLLQYNPVHKKVPVLVHNGKPIAESFIILEYIDGTWKNFLGSCPKIPIYELFEAMGRVLTCDGEEQEKAIKDTIERIKVLEEGMKGFYQEEARVVDERNFGIMDIMVCATFSTHRAFEEVLGVKILGQESSPFMFSWVQSLKELPLVKELTPPHDKLTGLLQIIRQNAIKSST